jgi:hypothetical protein
MKHIKLFENWLNESDSWADMVMSACSDFERSNPRGLDQLLAKDADAILNDENLMKIYNQAAACVVEPNVASGEEDADLGDYYERTEREGFGFVANVLEERPDGEKWVKFLDLVEEIGY